MEKEKLIKFLNGKHEGNPKPNSKELEMILESIKNPQSKKNIEALKAIYKDLGITGCSF